MKRFLAIAEIIIFTSALLLGITSIEVKADETIPTVVYLEKNTNYQLQTPDWSQISWSSLPPVSEPGKIIVSSDVVNMVGYDPSRSWSAGQQLDSIIMLGDVDDAFKISSFNLEDISTLTGDNLEQRSLGDFEVLKSQTPASLIKAIPDLGSLNVSQVQPIKKIFALSGIPTNSRIVDIVAANPTVANLPLGKINLQDYNINSIPGLTSTPIKKFKNWQSSFINQVPGLNKVSFAQMPQPIQDGNSIIGIASVVFGEAEHGDPSAGDNYFISGTVDRNDATVPIACDTENPCAYLELSDLQGKSGSLYGKRWVSGYSQQVPGGFGVLASVNNGVEPTGRLVYGNAFKVVMTETNESQGTANFGLFFRTCADTPFGKTCTPYFIGPVAWIPVREKDLVVVGVGNGN